jgi:hypothetical protein
MEYMIRADERIELWVKMPRWIALLFCRIKGYKGPMSGWPTEFNVQSQANPQGEPK